MPQRYKHLLPDEVRIWEKFLANPPVPFIRLHYDVHLGKGIEPKPDWPEWLVRQVRATTRKRVDVVAETPDELWIIELKPRGGMSALGQLLTYERLLKEEWAPTKPILKVLVCERLEPDIEAVLVEHGIRIYMV